MAEWTCPHGVGPTGTRGDCAPCNADIAGRPDPASMSGDERADEVRALLHDANAYRVSDIHKRLEQLVGRPVWTHEFVTDTRLIEEARGAAHPTDLRQHVIDSLRAVAGDKPIIVIELDDETSDAR